ncbi:MAG: DUF4340 domain-containing protein, partial [Silvanigrellaceae bacterium]|nr:DUF4340 domain-containing protein [Silvanigrellaceae bacterium]
SMKFVVKAALATLAVGAIAGIYYADDYFSEKKEEQKRKDEKAIYFDTAQVIKFGFKTTSGAFEFARNSVSDDWKITSPIAVLADQAAVGNLLSAISSTMVNQELSGTQSAIKGDEKELEKYGLKDPQLTVSVTLKDGSTQSLNVGSELNVGAKINSILQSVSAYALNPDKKNVLIISNTILSALKGKSIENLRSKKITKFSVADVSNIEINTKSLGISLGKKEGQWWVLQPANYQADVGNINSFLSQLGDLKADKVTEVSHVNDAFKLESGLNHPSGHINLKDGAGNTLVSLPVGMNKAGIFITIENGAVAHLSLEKWASLFPQLKYFRDKQVIKREMSDNIHAINIAKNIVFKKKDNAWYKVTSESQEIAKDSAANTDAGEFFSNWEFMMAEDIIDSPSKEDLVKYGLAKPLRTFSFLFKSEEKKPALEIIVGSRVPLDEKNIYIKKSDSKEVYIVDSQWLALLSKLEDEGKK